MCCFSRNINCYFNVLYVTIHVVMKSDCQFNIICCYNNKKIPHVNCTGICFFLQQDDHFVCCNEKLQCRFQLQPVIEMIVGFAGTVYSQICEYHTNCHRSYEKQPTVLKRVWTTNCELSCHMVEMSCIQSIENHPQHHTNSIIQLAIFSS